LKSIKQADSLSCILIEEKNRVLELANSVFIFRV